MAVWVPSLDTENTIISKSIQVSNFHGSFLEKHDMNSYANIYNKLIQVLRRKHSSRLRIIRYVCTQ